MKGKLTNKLMATAELGRAKTSYPEFALRPDTYLKVFDESQAVFTEYQAILNQIKLSATEKYAKREFDAQYSNVIKVDQFIMNERAADFKELASRDFISDFSSRYRRSYFRASHPYLPCLSPLVLRLLRTQNLRAYQVSSKSRGQREN